MISAGRRDRRIVFEKATVVIDAEGAEIPTWAPHFEMWSAVQFGSGHERRDAAQELGLQAATFVVLWCAEAAAVQIKDRISFDGSVWDITNRAPVGLNRELHFTATRQI